MGRDHSTECERCGTLYGGLNDPNTTACPDCLEEGERRYRITGIEEINSFLESPDRWRVWRVWVEGWHGPPDVGLFLVPEARAKQAEERAAYWNHRWLGACAQLAELRGAVEGCPDCSAAALERGGVDTEGERDG
jgi:hypothetical protein